MTLTAAFRRPFRFQVAAFRLRLQQLVPTARWDDIWQEQHDRAFMVAGAMKADLLADIAAAVDKFESQGTSLDEFRRDFFKIVEERGWHGWTGEDSARGRAWRTRVIYRTNMATSYAAGRWAQLREAGYPFIIYHHGNSLEPRVQHLAWDGLVLEADHPFWATHAPPNGWGCSCYVSGARTMDAARRQGGKPGKALPDGWQARDPRTGAPVGIDKGWAYAPGASVADLVARIAAKLPNLPPPLADSLRRHISQGTEEVTEAEIEELLSEFGTDSLESLKQRLTGRPDLGLGEVERLALAAYTSPGMFLALNDTLRSGAAGDDRLARFASLISRTLGRLPAHAGTVYRGVDVSPGLLNEFSTLQIGQVVRFRGFTSTSAVPEAALNGEVRLILNSRSGRRIEDLSLMQAEREVLFDKDSVFVVRRTWMDASGGYDVQVIEMDEVIDNGPGLAAKLMSESPE